MRILFVHHKRIDPFWGGVDRVTSLLSGEMKRRGHEVRFLSLSSLDGEEIELHGVKVDSIPVGNMDDDTFSSRFAEYLERGEIETVLFQDIQPLALRALRLTPADRYKIIVLHNEPYSILGKERIAKRLTPSSALRLKGKILKYLAMTAPALFRKLYLGKLRGKYLRIAHDADKFMMLSELSKEKIISVTPGIDASKIDAVNNPITFMPPGEQTSEKENIVLVVSRLSNAQKNLTGFIDVWALFHKSHPGWKAFVVGDGEDKDSIERYARKRGAEGIEFTGKRSDVEDFYRRAKILCMTSIYEGWPMVLMEAMAYGCVPVAYDSFMSVREIIDNERDGLIVAPFKKDRMASALSRLADDEAFRMKLAENAVRKINGFTVERIVDVWESKAPFRKV